MTAFSWAERPVFVTGATGFVGAWLVKRLDREGARVIALVRDQVEASLPPRTVVVRGSLEDYALMERALNEYEVEAVFHLGAQALVMAANRGPLSTFDANVRGTWNVLEACRRVSTVERIVVASSDKAYGTSPTLPYREDMPLHGHHPYDVSKSCADLIAQSYAVTYSLPVCITRFANIYGGGDLNFSRLIPGTMRDTVTGERPVIRSDGKFVRDYLYITDAVGAYLDLAAAMSDSSIHGEAFNFSSGFHVSVLDLTHRILRLAGREDLEPLVLDQAQNEIREQYLSAEKASNLLGWSASYAPDEALAETLDWYREYLAGRASQSPPPSR